MATPSSYGKYDLSSTQFSQAYFDRAWGDRLRQTDLGDVAEVISSEGKERLFLTQRLSGSALQLINEHETITGARSAEEFQKKVGLTKIVENYEPLADLRQLALYDGYNWSFTSTPYHDACGEWAGREKLFLIRENIAESLARLAVMLDSLDTRIHFEDGFRPLGVQEGLFLRRVAMAQDAHPTWTKEDLILEARSKTAYTARFAAHKAGAAVDLRLVSNSTDSFHDIGHDYPEGGEIVRLNTDFVTQDQWQNRKILEYLARSCGMSMYPFEDWHLSHGDATAAVVENPDGPYVAKYGPVKRFDDKSGKILEVYTEDELDSIFSTGI